MTLARGAETSASRRRFVGAAGVWSGLLLVSAAAGPPGPALAAVQPPRPPRKPPAPTRPVPPPSPDAPIKRFGPPSWGYQIDLPADWVVETPEAFTVVMSGPEGSQAFYAPVAIQNLRAPVPADPETSARQVLASHLARLRARHETLRVIRETRFRVPAGAADGDREVLPDGAQLVADWRGETGLVRQWVVVRPRPRAAVVHLWTFTAEKPVFDAWILVARAILDSWTLTPAAGNP